MNISQDKRKRLVYVARCYYLEEQKQSDIARELGISRPMVSRLLAEARELGVVEITIHDPETKTARLLDRLRSISSVQGGVLVEDSGDNDDVNRLLSQGALQLLQQLGARRLGVGWGYLIGQIVSWLEQNPQSGSTVTDICPLVGNASIPARNYQSNENIRLMAQQMGATPISSISRPSPKVWRKRRSSAQPKSTAAFTASGRCWTRPWSTSATTPPAPTLPPLCATAACCSSAGPAAGC